jgi:hypothetical protein
VIDPAPAVARQVSRVLNAQGLATAAGGPGRLVYYTSGDPAAFDRVRQQLGLEPAEVRAVRWLDNDIVEAAPAAPHAG